MSKYKKGEILNKKLEVVKKLGNGCFGSVYLVKDINLGGKELAVKVIEINFSNLHLVVNETRSLIKCADKNVVEIYSVDVDNDNGELYISMEYLSEGTLQTKITNDFLSSVEVVRFFIDVLFGLDCIHSKKLIHRDIKPDNILLKNNRAVVSDLGLCSEKQYCATSAFGYHTHKAPETLSDQTINVATDIYSVGITMFRCLNNIEDWRNYLSKIKNIEKIFYSGNLTKHLIFNEYCPSKLKTIIRKAIDKNPKKRYQSSCEMREALTRLKPKILWKKVTDELWLGDSCDSPDIYTLEIQSKRKTFLELKKNKRNCKISGQNKLEFDNKTDALNYLYKYISENSFY